MRLLLPESRVFDDIVPCLWDIDGSDIPGIVVGESYQRLGARLIASSADWRHVIRATYDNGRLEAVSLGPFRNATALDALLASRN